MSRPVAWPIERIKNGLDRFYKEFGRYPTATEFDAYDYLPRAKTIERRFGGLIAFRTQFKLGSEIDLRTGAHSSARAKAIGKRAHAVEAEVYAYLCKKFGREFVHREFFFTDDHRARADFFIFDRGSGFCVDVFYPKDRHNLIGCLNSKLNTYATGAMLQYPVIFLQMNTGISDDVLKSLVANKKRQLKPGQHLMGWEAFLQFCAKRNPLKILGRMRGGRIITTLEV